MANKKTVMEQYDAVKAMLNGETVEGYTLADAVAFIDKRMEITAKKNASGKNAEPTPKQREKMAETERMKSDVLSVMADNTQYSPTDLLKLVDNPAITSTQKLTPLLTALIGDGAIVKNTVKGRSVYSLPTVAEVAED